MLVPLDNYDLIQTCAELALAALRRSDGHVIVFLPGYHDLVQVQILFYKRASQEQVAEISCPMLHSEMFGPAEDDQRNRCDVRNGIMMLASAVAARAVTFPSLKHVFIHPLARTTVMHSSGALELVA